MAYFPRSVPPEGAEPERVVVDDLPIGTPVPVDFPEGMFPASGTQERLHWYRFSGWQNVDEEHPVGGGSWGYRCVYKMLRIVPDRPVALCAPNLRVVVASGYVDHGSATIPGTIPWRRSNRSVIPELGAFVGKEDCRRYIVEHNLFFNMKCDQANLGPLSYIEFILLTEADEPDQIVHEGRHRLAPIFAACDFLFGERSLGLLLNEEVGKVFGDWHWNRYLGSNEVAGESHLKLDIRSGHKFIDELNDVMDVVVALDETRRNRLRLACDWYWKAEAEIDPTDRFLFLWFSVEALEMRSSDPTPVKERLSILTGEPRSRWSPIVGRIFRQRGQIVHGQTRTVAPGNSEALDSIAEELIKSRLGLMVDRQRLLEILVGTDR